MTPYLKQLEERRNFFQANYPQVNFGLEQVDSKSREKLKNTCPVCGYMTLSSRINWDICSICFWEDDGSDDYCANEVSGPNHKTLIEGRIEFESTWLKFNNVTTNESINFLRKKFFELNNLIDGDRVDYLQSIIELQKEILVFLNRKRIYSIAKLFK